MEHMPHAPRHEDAGEELHLPDDPPEEEDEDGDGDGGEPETEEAKKDRFEADRRIKDSPEMQRHILAFYLEGVPRGEIAASLERFGLKAKKGIAALQTANLKALRAGIPLSAIKAERDEARKYIVEKLPHLAWRLLPSSRAFLAYCLRDTRATLRLIAQASAAYMKTLAPALPGASSDALSDLVNSEKGGGSREGLARFLRSRPHKLSEVQLARAREEGEERFGTQFKREESLSRFQSEWILDDNNRALLVALLDLGEDKARQSAITWAIATSIPDSGVTISMININVRQYGGYQQFADAIRVGTEDIAPGLKEQAERLVAEYDAKIETGKIPEWRKTPEQKAFLCFLIQESGLSSDLMSWAHSAKFGTPVNHSALKEYIRSRGGGAAYAGVLRSEITDEHLRAAAAIDLTKLTGYKELSPQKQRSVNVVALERFKPMQRLAESLKKRERSTVPRVNLYYGRGTLQAEKEGKMVAVNPKGALPEAVTIEFLPSAPKGAGEDERAATDNATKLREFLLKELAWISDKKARSTGGSVSALAYALLDPEKTGEPIRTVTMRWKAYGAEGKVEEGNARFQIHRPFIDAVRSLEQTARQRKQGQEGGNDSGEE